VELLTKEVCKSLLKLSMLQMSSKHGSWNRAYIYRVIQKVTDKRKPSVGGTIPSQKKIGCGCAHCTVFKLGPKYLYCSQSEVSAGTLKRAARITVAKYLSLSINECVACSALTEPWREIGHCRFNCCLCFMIIICLVLVRMASLSDYYAGASGSNLACGAVFLRFFPALLITDLLSRIC